MKDIHFAHLSLPKIHLKKHTWKKEYQYKGHQPNVNMNATHLVCFFKFQDDGIAKVNNFFHVDLKTPTHQICDMDKTKHLTKNSIAC